MEIRLVKLNNGDFRAAYDTDWEIACKIKEGEIFAYNVIKERFIEMHNKYFALIKLAFDAQERFTSIKKFRDFLTIEAGFYEWALNKKGDYTIKPLSASFENMDQFAFQELYDRTKDIICIHCRLTNEAIENNIHLNF